MSNPQSQIVILSRADGEESLTISARWGRRNDQRCFSRAAGST
jgi:hypothetical protein